MVCQNYPIRRCADPALPRCAAVAKPAKRREWFCRCDKPVHRAPRTPSAPHPQRLGGTKADCAAMDAEICAAPHSLPLGVARSLLL